MTMFRDIRKGMSQEAVKLERLINVSQEHGIDPLVTIANSEARTGRKGITKPRMRSKAPIHVDAGILPSSLSESFKSQEHEIRAAERIYRQHKRTGSRKAWKNYCHRTGFPRDYFGAWND